MEKMDNMPEKAIQSVDKFTINPETGMIISDGHEYANTPRVRSFIRRANNLREGLPPLPENLARLWRGNRPGEVGKNPSFTNALEGIALPFLDSYCGELSYIEVPKEDLERYLQTGAAASGAEFILPEEIAKTAKTIEDPLRPKPAMSEQEYKENRQRLPVPTDEIWKAFYEFIEPEQDA